jgi:FKBP-type peptidyl-prolyl cis-trans isomerase
MKTSLFDDDDDNLLFSNASTAPKTRLGDVFKSDTTPPTGNEKLTYERPKQPNPNAPKGPSQQQQQPTKTSTTPTSPQIMFYQAIQLYKYPNPMGTAMAAFLKSEQPQVNFTLLFYYSPQKPIAKINITPDFNYVVQSQGGDLWGTLADETKQNWSIRFLKQEDSDQFALHIALAKYHVSNAQNIVIQDLQLPSKGRSVERGDWVAMRFVAYLDAGGKLGIKVESNMDKDSKLYRFEVGKGTTTPIAWDRIALGMKKGQRRVFVVPPSQGYGEKGNPSLNIPANATLVYLCELEKHKRGDSKEIGSEPQQQQQTTATRSPPLPRSGDDGGTEKSGKSMRIIDRVARLGIPTGIPILRHQPGSEEPVLDMNIPNLQQHQFHLQQQQQQPTHLVPVESHTATVQVPTAPTPTTLPVAVLPPAAQMPQGATPSTLPTLTATTSPPYVPLLHQQPQQSTNTLPTNTSQPTPSILTQTPLFTPQQPQTSTQLVLASSYPPPQSQTSPPSQALLQTSAIYPQQSSSSSIPSTSLIISAPPQGTTSTIQTSTPSTDVIQLLVDERQFKTEIKSKLENVTTKVEQLGQKFDDFFSAKGKDIGGMSPKTLLETIQKIVTDNEKLRTDLEEKMNHINTLRENINQLHERNQRVIDENSKFSQERLQLRQLESIKEERLRLQQELTVAQQDKAKLQREISQLNDEKRKLEDELNEARQTIAEWTRRMGLAKRAYQQLEEQLNSLKEELEHEKAEKETLKMTMATLTVEKQKFEAKIREEQSEIKRMNNEIQTLKNELEEEKENTQKLAKLVEDTKRKYATELKRRETAFEDEKNALEQQIEELRSSLKKERLNSGASKEQIERIEHEVEQKWKSFYAQKQQETLITLQKESAQLIEDYERKCEDLKNQLQKQQQQHAEYIKQLTTEYEAKIHELQQQQQPLPPSTNESEELRKENARLRALIQQQTMELQDVQNTIANSIKAIMNSVYMTFMETFEEQKTYDTNTILHTIKNVIVTSTLNVLNNQQTQNEQNKREHQSAIDQQQPEEQERLQQQSQQEQEHQEQLQQQQEQEQHEQEQLQQQEQEQEQEQQHEQEQQQQQEQQQERHEQEKLQQQQERHEQEQHEQQEHSQNEGNEVFVQEHNVITKQLPPQPREEQKEEPKQNIESSLHLQREVEFVNEPSEGRTNEVPRATSDLSSQSTTATEERFADTNSMVTTTDLNQKEERFQTSLVSDLQTHSEPERNVIATDTSQQQQQVEDITTTGDKKQEDAHESLPTKDELLTASTFEAHRKEKNELPLSNDKTESDRTSIEAPSQPPAIVAVEQSTEVQDITQANADALTKTDEEATEIGAATEEQQPNRSTLSGPSVATDTETNKGENVDKKNEDEKGDNIFGKDISFTSNENVATEDNNIDLFDERSNELLRSTIEPLANEQQQSTKETSVTNAETEGNASLPITTVSAQKQSPVVSKSSIMEIFGDLETPTTPPKEKKKSIFDDEDDLF